MGTKDEWAADKAAIRDFIEKWRGTGGAENANFQTFASHLARVLEVDEPDGAVPENEHNDYVFERAVKHVFEDGRETTRRIDLYKRGHFIMEGKQSAPREIEAAKQARLFEETGETPQGRKAGHAARGSAAWDKVMRSARNQATGYTRDLPPSHGYPPFILVVDVGHVIDVFADFSGQGRNYAFFPDRQSYRIRLEDLRDPKVQRRLRAVWTDPLSLDPARKSAEVTKEIAALLAEVSKTLEKRYDKRQVAEFLSRCLFTMYAEDVELLPKRSFETFLEERVLQNANFPAALERLWKDMNEGGYNGVFDAVLRRFNGTLFADAEALTLDSDEIRTLWAAAKKDWTNVEPAIFGTLLEQALDPKERGQLGAHFTPRAYVERLVIPTIIEPLREDWEAVQQRAAELEDEGEHDAAVKALRDFHHQLATTRVLDPACGTGNFLYVALELMKRLEAEVIEAIEAADPKEGRLALEGRGETVSPAQFYGLEINPRAVPIADLVLWIGYIKWQLKTVGIEGITDPVLRAYGNIRCQDAILAYDDKALLTDEHGKPVMRWNGYALKRNPLTGAEVPDLSQKEEAYSYTNPHVPPWPKAAFVIGNPPFLGNKKLKRNLGPEYVDSLYNTTKMPNGTDLFMYWWDRCAHELSDGNIRRFGLVTSNSVRQQSNAKWVEQYLSDRDGPLSIKMAIADQVWGVVSHDAAVRVSMMCLTRGKQEGSLLRPINEGEVNTEYAMRQGSISSHLRLGAELHETVALRSNEKVAYQGMIPSGDGFRLDGTSTALIRKYENTPFLKRYWIGDDITEGDRGEWAIDFYETDEIKARSQARPLYDHLYETVRDERLANKEDRQRRYWWKFARDRGDLRKSIDGFNHYIGVPDTSKHTPFVLVDSSILADAQVYVIATERRDILSVLTSRSHAIWLQHKAPRHGKGNDIRWKPGQVFAPFPFPAVLTNRDGDTTGLADLGERLDTFRKERLADWDWLTMTRLYNALERYREALALGEELTDAEKDAHRRARVSELADLHDAIDREVLAAYGWSDLEGALVGLPGGTTPSPHKSPEQEEAEEELLVRLVALNQERAAEEARGHVRWLRPEYQVPKLGHKVAKPDGEEAPAPEPIAVADKPAWPKDGLDQIRLVREVLDAARGPVDAVAVGRTFKGALTKKKRERIGDVLAGLHDMGLARRSDDGGYVGGR